MSKDYGPELIEIMGRALDSASAQATHLGGDAELARLVMASAIIDEVDAGVRTHDLLVLAALDALRLATTLSRSNLGPT
jgi:hypothetical protein